MSLKRLPVARFGLVGVLGAALVCLGCGRSETSEEANGGEENGAKVVVKTAPVETRLVQETVSGIGRTEALPNHLAPLTPALEGHVHEIRANLGAALHAGDVIVELDTTLAKADLAEKEASRDTLKAALDLLQAAPRPEDRQGLEIAVAQAIAATARAQAALDRLEPLRARKEIPAAQVYESEQAVVQAKLQQRMAEAQLALLLAGPRPEAVEEAKARLAATDGLVALSRHRLELLSIRSPIDGMLDSLHCHPGQTIAAGIPIGEVVDTRQLNLVVWLPPQSAAQVKVGQAARLITAAGSSGPAESSPDDSHRESTSLPKVISVGQVIDAQTGSLPVRILLDNALGQVAVGQTLSVAIVTHEHADELVTPAAAVIDLGEGPLVVVVREGKIHHLHPTSIANHGEWTVIEGTDLKAGEPVVVDGGFHLPDETSVVTEPAQPPATAEAS
jgi:HlyD family secretion protein